MYNALLVGPSTVKHEEYCILFFVFDRKKKKERKGVWAGPKLHQLLVHTVTLANFS